MYAFDKNQIRFLQKVNKVLERTKYGFHEEFKKSSWRPF